MEYLLIALGIFMIAIGITFINEVRNAKLS